MPSVPKEAWIGLFYELMLLYNNVAKLRQKLDRAHHAFAPNSAPGVRLGAAHRDCRLVASGCFRLRFLSDFAQVAFGATALDAEKSCDIFHPFIIFCAEFATRTQDLVDQLVGLLTAFDIGW